MSYIQGLKGKRESAGLSQNELARKAGVDRATIARCENGYNVRPEKANLIRNALNKEEMYRGAPLPDTIIVDGGKTGEFPKRKKK